MKLLSTTIIYCSKSQTSCTFLRKVSIYQRVYRRTRRTMAYRKRAKQKIRIYIKQHSKLNMEQHEFPLKQGELLSLRVEIRLELIWKTNNYSTVNSSKISFKKQKHSSNWFLHVRTLKLKYVWYCPLFANIISVLCRKVSSTIKSKKIKLKHKFFRRQINILLIVRDTLC